PKTEGVLERVQNTLFVVGSNLATDPSKAMDIPHVQLSDITLLENEIDRMEADLPPLKTFILPGGHPTVSQIHIARCVCRRAERDVVGLALIDEVPDVILQYLNRLSDYLFVLSRWVGMRLDAKELPWKP
ncbi:MAG TPA: cob(I)yrinic acid a,c-diamide adenosyltransferase, partial [Phaeodactylibacter sp.]|nr:cob(I)yrinic acid a,c-diamide adenosyltransferase [Phaeodactylibacter sp.]